MSTVDRTVTVCCCAAAELCSDILTLIHVTCPNSLHRTSTYYESRKYSLHGIPNHNNHNLVIRSKTAGSSLLKKIVSYFLWMCSDLWGWQHIPQYARHEAEIHAVLTVWVSGYLYKRKD